MPQGPLSPAQCNRATRTAPVPWTAAAAPKPMSSSCLRAPRALRSVSLWQCPSSAVLRQETFVPCPAAEARNSSIDVK